MLVKLAPGEYGVPTPSIKTLLASAFNILLQSEAVYLVGLSGSAFMLHVNSLMP